MSDTLLQHPDAIVDLADHLHLDPNQFIDETEAGRRGFFRYGRTEADACRYCLDPEEGHLIGLCIRGQGVTDLNWLDDEAFHQIEDLYFGENEFTRLDIPASWTRLRRIDLSGSKHLSHVRFLGAADQLERLEITDSGLFRLSLPASGCPQLQFLNLSRNAELTQLTLPGPCSSLHSLHLRAAAQLETLEVETPLPKLDTLELTGCTKLTELPAGVILNSPLERLYLENCMPRNCPSYLCTNKSLVGVKAWFRELEKGSTPNTRVKLLITGNGDVGKSTVQCALSKPKELYCTCATEHDTTHGIQIGTFTHDGISFSYWDFGGQDVYGATHRLFFADEAVQLLVFDPYYENMARRGEEGSDRTANGLEQKHQLEYYHAIQRQKSRYDTFIIVQNKKRKTDPEGETDYRLPDPQLTQYAKDHLQDRFHHVDALEGPGMSDLLAEVVRLGKQLPRYGMPFPTTWLDVREWFTKNDQPGPDKRQRITTRFFREEICAPRGVTDTDAQQELLKFLESAGYCYVIDNVRRGEEDPEGSDIIVDQEWALQAVYRPLDREKVGPLWRRLHGLVPKTMILDAFGPNYSPGDKELLLRFMEDNALCFRAFGKDEDAPKAPATRDYVFPAYLPDGLPGALETLDKVPGVLRFRTKVPYLNRTDFQRFLCQLGAKITNFDNLTRNGIYLYTEEGALGANIDYATRCYEVRCEPAAAVTWLESLLEECPSGEAGWEIEGPDGYVVFDPQTLFSQRGDREGKDLKKDLADLADRLHGLPASALEPRLKLAEVKQDLEVLLSKNQYDQYFVRMTDMVVSSSPRYAGLIGLKADYNDYLERQIDGTFRAEEERVRRGELFRGCYALLMRLEPTDCK